MLQPEPRISVVVDLGDASGHSLAEVQARFDGYKAALPAGLDAPIDSVIEEFNQHFQGDLKLEPLARSEKALLKTFLQYHLIYKPKKPREGDALSEE